MSGSELKKSFGDRLHFLREHYHFTQEKLAGLLEYSTTSERKLEKGLGGASFKTLIKLAEVFKIEIIDLFQFDESIPQEKTTDSLDREILRQRLGERLRFLRDIRQLTQREVARGIGITERFLGAVERGEQGPSFDTLAELADFLDVDVKELFRFGKSFPPDRQSAPEKPPEASPQS